MDDREQEDDTENSTDYGLESGHAAPPPGLEASPDDERRGFIASLIAAVAGGIAGLAPLAAGLRMFASPLLPRAGDKGGDSSREGKGKKPFLRVASLDSIPNDGTPVQVPVIADLVDAWNKLPHQPIGAVYLRKAADGTVACFNAICPHAGCFVGFAAERKVFQCPCHTSAFTLEGTAIQPSPSPRDMDALEVDRQRLDQGEVWVRFTSYLPGKTEQVEK
jgi:menaquinol-cytochrome c reductase iron-sulfur subunit